MPYFLDGNLKKEPIFTKKERRQLSKRRAYLAGVMNFHYSYTKDKHVDQILQAALRKDHIELFEYDLHACALAQADKDISINNEIVSEYFGITWPWE